MPRTKNATLIGIVLICALGVSALAAYVHFVPKAVVPGAKPPEGQTPIVLPPPTQDSKPVSVLITVYNPHMGMNGIEFDTQQVPVPDGVDPKMFAVAQFLRVSQIVPSQAQLLGIQVIDGVAHLGFNRAFDRTYGTFEEKSLLDGFAAALGQFPEIKSYQLEIDAKLIPTLGNYSLTDPYPVIRPADVPRPQPTNPPPTPTDQSPSEPNPQGPGPNEPGPNEPGPKKPSPGTPFPANGKTNLGAQPGGSLNGDTKASAPSPASSADPGATSTPPKTGPGSH